MSYSLFEYVHPTKNKKGIIVQKGSCFGDISPLPNWSEESFEEALEETIEVLTNQKKPKFPSVRFGLSCLNQPLTPFAVNLCALNQPKPGCKSLKLKLGNLNLSEAINLVLEYKSHFKLRLDFNQKWDFEKLMAFVNNFSKEDFEYLEDPTQTIQELYKFSEITKFPIAIDDFYRKNLDTKIPHLKAIVIKPTLSNPNVTLPVPVILSSCYESSLGIAHIANLAQNNLCQGLDTFYDDFLSPPLYVKEGKLIWEGSKNPIIKEKLCHITTVPS